MTQSTTHANPQAAAVQFDPLPLYRRVFSRLSPAKGKSPGQRRYRELVVLQGTVLRSGSAFPVYRVDELRHNGAAASGYNVSETVCATWSEVSGRLGAASADFERRGYERGATYGALSINPTRSEQEAAARQYREDEAFRESAASRSGAYQRATACSIPGVLA